MSRHVTSYHISHHISYHVTSRHVMSYPISYHVTSRHVISYIIVSYHVTSCHVISYHISCHVTSYHIVSYHIISRHVMSCHIIYHMSRHVISYIIYIISTFLFQDSRNFLDQMCEYQLQVSILSAGEGVGREGGNRSIHRDVLPCCMNANYTAGASFHFASYNFFV